MSLSVNKTLSLWLLGHPARCMRSTWVRRSTRTLSVSSSIKGTLLRKPPNSLLHTHLDCTWMGWFLMLETCKRFLNWAEQCPRLSSSWCTSTLLRNTKKGMSWKSSWGLTRSIKNSLRLKLTQAMKIELSTTSNKIHPNSSPRHLYLSWIISCSQLSRRNSTKLTFN